MSIVYVNGCSIADTVFTLNASVTGEEITWNVTKLKRDAAAGVFGDTTRLPMYLLPPMKEEHKANIDWQKVALFAELPSVLVEPVIAIGSLTGILCFPDGSHRLVARQQRSFPSFETYIVPHDIEHLYRVTETVFP